MDISVNRRIMAQHGNSKPKGGASLQTEFPMIAKLWHPNRNEASPSDVRPKSNIKRWWLCSKSKCKHSHEWFAPPDRLVKAFEKDASGCPYCSGRIVCRCNSLGNLHPDIAKFWHTENNAELSSFDIAPQSNKKIWWKCPKGPDHEWQTSPSGMVSRSRGCPFCSKPPKKVSITNCMATKRPDMIQYWYQELNEEITPFDIFPGSNKQYWWKCPEGSDHIWKARPEQIGSALSSKFLGFGCPFCSSRKLSITNRLDLNFSHIAIEWHPTMNGTLTPADVTAYSHKKVWWQCQTNSEHVWECNISSRTSKGGTGCPSCATSGIIKDEPTFLYSMKICSPSGIWWWKVGVSVDPWRRAKTIENSIKNSGMELSVMIHELRVLVTAEEALKIEHRLKSEESIRAKSEEKFDGSTELFISNPLQFAKDNEIIEHSID